MKFPIKKGWAIAIGVVLLLWILNPGISSFRDYIGDKDVTRKGNFIVFSIYQDSYGSNYAGFLLNFVKIPVASVASAYQYNPNTITVDSTAVDSTLMDSTKMIADSINNKSSHHKKEAFDFNKAFDEAARESEKNNKP